MDNIFEHRTGPAELAAVTQYPAHRVPAWFTDAKLGFFIHLGIYSVPAWAYHRVGDAVTPPEQAYDLHEYAEWYANTVRIAGSPCQRYHEGKYGVGTTYEDLAPRFRPDPKNLRELVARLARAGGRYIIPTTKHHDGYCLWDTATTSFSGPKRGSGDVIDVIARAVRAEGARLGLYFSGALDWHVSEFGPIRSDEDLFNFRRNDAAFARYAAAQLEELVERYQPDVLWNDIEWPDAGKGPDDWGLAAVLGRYLAGNPDATINDRWGIPLHGYLTREYTKVTQSLPEPWESTRGINRSFGYNANDHPEDRMSPREAVELLVDVVTLGGNLLLNVGPRADGTLDAHQGAVVDALAEWMGVYGRYLYGSRPADFSWGAGGRADVSRAGAAERRPAGGGHATSPSPTAHSGRPRAVEGPAGLAVFVYPGESFTHEGGYWLMPDGSRHAATATAPQSEMPYALIIERKS